MTMASPLDKFKQDHPEYADASNQEAGRAMYDMYYKDKISQEDFVGKLKASMEPEQSAWTDVPEQIWAGAGRGILNTAASINDMAAYMEERIPLGGVKVDSSGVHWESDMSDEMRADSAALTKSAREDLPQPDGLPGAITGTLAQFAVPFTAANKAISSANAAKNVFLRGAAAGAVADFSAFDPHEQRLSNMLTEFDSPLLNNVVTQYLAADKEDTNLEGRLKQVIEGGVVGAALEPLVRGMANGLRWIKGKRRAQLAAKASENVKDVKATVPEKGETRVEPPAADDFKKSKEVIFTHAATKADKVDNLNMSKYPTREVTKGFLEKMDKVFGTPVPKTTWASQDSMAKDMGLGLGDIITFSKNVENFDGILAQAHSYLTDGVRDLKLQADKIRGGKGTEDDLIKFTAGIKQLANYEYAVKSMTATAGRTLNRLKGLRDAGLSNSEALDDFLKGKQVSRDHIKVVAEAMSEAQTVGQARRMAKKFVQKPTRVDAVLELYINSLLSGLRTQVTNLASTATSIAWTIPERYIAAGIGSIRKALGSKRTNYATIKEANAYFGGAFQGAADAMGLLSHILKDAGTDWKNAWKTRGMSLLKDPDADLTKIKVGDKIITDPMGKLELEKHQAIRGDVVLGDKIAKSDNKAARAAVRTVDLLGEWVFRMPGRALYMGDSLMKTIGYRMELNASATRQAMDEVASGKIKPSQAGARVKELFDKAVDYGAELPEKIAKSDQVYKDLHDNAIENGARYLTFTRQLGSAGRAVQHATGVHPIIRSAVPFVRTPINILKFSGERTPLAPASKAVREQLRSATAKSDIQYARMVFSSLVGIGVYDAATSGHFTGSFPAFDPEEKERWYNAGLQPNSFVDKNGWLGKPGEVYSLSRFEPASTIFGIASDLALLKEYVTDEEEEHLSSMVVASIANNMTNKTYLKTVTDFSVMVQDPDRHLDGFLRDYGSSLVTAPLGGTITAHIAQQQDPYLKDAQTFIDAIKARIPYMRGEVPDRVNDYGEPIELGDAWGPDIASPIFKSQLTDDKLKKEVFKLGVPLNNPPRKIDGVELEPEEYRRMRTLAGKRFQEIAGQVVRGPLFRREGMTNAKANVIKDVWVKVNAAARDQMRAEIKERVIKKQQEDAVKMTQ